MIDTPKLFQCTRLKQQCLRQCRLASIDMCQYTDNKSFHIALLFYLFI